jgi:hypothetical protein
MNIINRILKDALIKILRMIGRMQAKYPSKLRHKTRADFIQKMKDQNKGDK